MENTKRCPYCAEVIQAAAILCRYCGRAMPGYEDKIPASVAVPQQPPATPAAPVRRRRRWLWMPIVLLVAAALIAVAAYLPKTGPDGPPTEITLTATTHTVEPTSPPSAVPSPSSPAGIRCDRALSYVGEYETVCGPVVDARYAQSTDGQPTFLNLCKKYTPSPDPGRFTVLIWGTNRSNFPGNPEQYYLGKIICVTGLIEEYKGGPEIEASEPSQIETR